MKNENYLRHKKLISDRENAIIPGIVIVGAGLVPALIRAPTRGAPTKTMIKTQFLNRL